MSTWNELLNVKVGPLLLFQDCGTNVGGSCLLLALLHNGQLRCALHKYREQTEEISFTVFIEEVLL